MRHDSETWRRQLARRAPLVLALSLAGSVASLVSQYSSGPTAVGLVNLSQVIGCLFAVYGYMYASTVWPLPGLHWIVLVVLGLNFALHQTLLSAGPQQLDLILNLLDWLWRFWLLLVGVIGVGAAIGWGKYFVDRRTGFAL